MHRPPLSFALAIVAVTAVRAAAQVPAGGEFRVNTYTTYVQWNPSIAADAAGRFMVVWRSIGQDGDQDGVFGQRYGADGTPLGGELQVNTYTIHDQTPRLQGAVAAMGGGGFVVVWESYRQDGPTFGVFGRRYDAAGNAVGTEFRVAAATTEYQVFPVVAGSRDGFTVAWMAADGSDVGIFARRFAPSGQSLGAAFRVNAYTSSFQDDPSVACADGAGCLVVWRSNGQDGYGWGVFGRRYLPSGGPLGGEFQVTASGAGLQSSPDAAIAPDGRFVVVWEDNRIDGDLNGIAGRRFDATGQPVGGDFRVNAATTGLQVIPAVAMDEAGAFAVVWADMLDGSSYGISGRRFDAAGQPRGPDFRVNTVTSLQQHVPAVAVDAVGNVVVAWESWDQPPGFPEVQAQRFGGLLPAALGVNGLGNGVFEPGETVDVRPSWRNVNGAAQTFGSIAPTFTGPPGATYSLLDAAADYGTVADGATAVCGNCFVAAIHNAGLRPLLHWDAVLEESITPDALGQDKLWRLHVGDSFTDVPPTSGFYRHVETLLHHGVTGGCGGEAYCPTGAATREQMALFVLVAREGAAYRPPACAPPNLFADVPETSAFCPWIEELANRGVVAGCGGGNYCPQDAVTREQMAVFVLRALDPALDPAACAPPNLFADVPETSTFCRWIEELARRGIVAGCGGGNYCPAAPVTREQMAVFLAGTFGLALYGP